MQPIELLAIGEPLPLGIPLIDWLFFSAIVVLAVGWILLGRYPKSTPEIALGCICAFATMVFAIMWAAFVDSSASGFWTAIIAGTICSAVFGSFVWVLMRKR